MALRSNLVNLDAMIKREDFATSDKANSTYENVFTIGVRDYTPGGLIGPSLRKPDFQRETNHWRPEQVVSLIDCFANGDLIPSVILWQSPTYLFVIDGGHRLSVLRAWVEDDYGDGPTSQTFFGYEISKEQKKIAQKTRELVNKRVGSWAHHQRRIEDLSLDHAERAKLTTIVSRGLPIQWVKGDAEKAESSFFKINTKGTPLDDIEELLLRNRRKPIPIAARAIIRAGKGHRYWSSFPPTAVSQIEKLANDLHVTLFEPEVNSPIKTLDLPLGGPKGVRDALQVLIDVVLIASRNQQGLPRRVSDVDDDEDGSGTIAVLSKTLRLARWITGNEDGSLGLHPAIYFYGPTGRHSGPMFMGTLALIAEKLSNNDGEFFKKFTRIRKDLEHMLIQNKELIATIIQKLPSAGRVQRYKILLNAVISILLQGQLVVETSLVELAGLEGKIVVGNLIDQGERFSDDRKSEAFIRTALGSAIKCPICHGYLDPNKSVSYDHETPVRDGGLGNTENCALTHPYCNQSVKH